MLFKSFECFLGFYSEQTCIVDNLYHLNVISICAVIWKRIVDMVMFMKSVLAVGALTTSKFSIMEKSPQDII